MSLRDRLCRVYRDCAQFVHFYRLAKLMTEAERRECLLKHTHVLVHRLPWYTRLWHALTPWRKSKPCIRMYSLEIVDRLKPLDGGMTWYHEGKKER